uniref:Uncharacterized protein n=1 Tax=Panagrolaimus superbus TaxID=310955 RepID=A0A914YC44_9BILA
MRLIVAINELISANFVAISDISINYMIISGTNEYTVFGLFRLAAINAVLSTLGTIVFERIYATVYLETYEKTVSNPFFFYCVLYHALEYCIATFSIYQEWIDLAIFGTVIIILNVIGYLMFTCLEWFNLRKYRTSLAHRKRYTLSERFQLQENIRTAHLMKHVAGVVVFLDILVGSAMIISRFYEFDEIAKDETRIDTVSSSQSPYGLRKRSSVSYVENTFEEVDGEEEDNEIEKGDDSDTHEQSETAPSRSSYGLRKRSRVSYFGNDPARHGVQQKDEKKKPKNHYSCSNFELRTLVHGYKHLFIFPSDDHSTCYRFTPDTNKRFTCSQCFNVFKITSSAWLKRGPGGVEFVEMIEGHLCEPLKYYESNVQRITNFEEYIDEYKKELFVFGSDDKSTYYRYCYHKDKYVCILCNKMKKVTEAVVKSENGETVVEGETIHACQPIPYIQKIKVPDFELRQNVNGNPQLVIFDLEDRSLCHQFNWHKTQKVFCCFRCISKTGTLASASVKKLPSGEEFVQQYNPHGCSPIAYVAR